MNKKWFRALFRQRMLIALLLIVQFIFMIYLLLSSSATSNVIAGVLNFISVVVALYIFSRKDKGAYKLTWVFMILLFPLFGGLFYLLFSFQSTFRASSKRVDAIAKRTCHYFDLPGTDFDRAKMLLAEATSSLTYMQHYAGFPVYTGGETIYLTPGEEMFKQLVSGLEKAENTFSSNILLFRKEKCGTPFLIF